MNGVCIQSKERPLLKMNKVFLSHSSKNKKEYVRIVAEKLGAENIEYDEWSFEEGEKTTEEIEKRIDNSDLFALFISNDSLDSGWVEKEIVRAIKQLEAGRIKKIYPIIIDPTINYSDSRIPEFLRENYNLKFISRPSIAARRILSKLRELHWEKPDLINRKNIFVGRNGLLNSFEERIDDIDLPKPICIIASGIPKIGRSSLLRYCLIKANIVGSSYIPLKITLDRVDSIEDLILKLFDTGLTSIERDELLDMLSKSMEDKEDLLNRMIKDVQDAKEIIFIEDAGCLITHTRELTPWLISAIGKNLVNRPVLCIASKYRVNFAQIRPYKEIFALEVPELSPQERSGLLKRLMELHEIDITSKDFSFFSEQLHGFPEEAYYCMDLIIDYGIEGAKNESHQITEFNTERASVLLRKYDQDKNALDFIYLLSRFEFISTSLIFEIVDEETYRPLLDDLVTHLICDYVGGEHEFIRINDAIRDLIQRNRLEIPEEFKAKLRTHVKEFVKDTQKFERDSSDFLFSVKEALARNEKIDERYLIPSHILRTIRDLYYSRENLKRVVYLADMLLQKEHTLDKQVCDDVRYYLCLSLARQKDKRVLQEAIKIRGPEHDFVLGYYFRLCGRHIDAITRLSKLITMPYIASRAKRELVQVYLYIEEFDLALEMARENYEANKGNQFPIQSYLHCLLNSNDPNKHRGEIIRLIEELGQIGSIQSKEMMFIAQGMYEARLNNSKPRAYNYMDDAIALNQDTHYPYLAKFDVALRFRDVEMMEVLLNIIDKLSESKTFSKNTIIKNKAFYLAALGNKDEALRLIESGLDNYPQETIEKFKAKINSVFQNKMQ